MKVKHMSLYDWHKKYDINMQHIGYKHAIASKMGVMLSAIQQYFEKKTKTEQIKKILNSIFETKERLVLYRSVTPIDIDAILQSRTRYAHLFELTRNLSIARKAIANKRAALHGWQMVADLFERCFEVKKRHCGIDTVLTTISKTKETMRAYRKSHQELAVEFNATACPLCEK